MDSYKDLTSLLKNYGENSTSYLTLNRNNKIFLSKLVDGYISYRQYCNTIVVLGDPICFEKDTNEILNEIKEYSERNKLKLCFFAANKTNIKSYKKALFRGIAIGDEAIIDLEEFSLKGNKMENVRRGVNHAKLSKLTINEYLINTERDQNIDRKLFAVSRDWQTMLKGAPELSFMVSRLSLETPTELRYFIATRDNKIEGFLVYAPIYATNSYYLDINRRRLSSPNGVMELLMTESFEKFKREGAKSIHLGLSPFSNISLDSDHRNYLFYRIMRFLFNHFDFLYPARSQHFFKKKFRPRWEKCYLFAYPNFSIKMVYAIFRAFCPGGIRGVIQHKLTVDKYTGVDQ